MKILYSHHRDTLESRERQDIQENLWVNNNLDI